jgi:hypothetical protein
VWGVPVHAAGTCAMRSLQVPHPAQKARQFECSDAETGGHGVTDHRHDPNSLPQSTAHLSLSFLPCSRRQPVGVSDVFNKSPVLPAHRTYLVADLPSLQLGQGRILGIHESAPRPIHIAIKPISLRDYPSVRAAQPPFLRTHSSAIQTLGPQISTANQR